MSQNPAALVRSDSPIETNEDVYREIARIIDSLGGDVTRFLVDGTEYSFISARFSDALDLLGFPGAHMLDGVELMEALDTIRRWSGCVDHDFCRNNREIARFCHFGATMSTRDWECPICRKPVTKTRLDKDEITRDVWLSVTCHGERRHHRVSQEVLEDSSQSARLLLERASIEIISRLDRCVEHSDCAENAEMGRVCLFDRRPELRRLVATGGIAP